MMGPGLQANVRRESATMTSEFVLTSRRTVGVLDIPRALFAPRGVFGRVEDVPAYAWALVLLLVSVTMLGYLLVETGLIDREVELQVQKNIAALELEQLDVVERSALSDMIADKKKEGEFLRLIRRVQVIGASPIATLACVLLIPAMLFGLVALTGKKPEWHTLVTICVFAGFADVIGTIVRLGMRLQFRTLFVDTSLAPLTNFMQGQSAQANAALGGLLTAFDPFRIWFWLIMVVGLTVTRQLRGWRAWCACLFFWLAAAGLRAAIAVVAMQSAAGA